MKDDAMRYFRLFRDVCSKINSSHELNEVLRLITENTTAILGTKGCAIYLLDKKENRLKVSASHGLSNTYMQKGTVDAEKSMVGCLSGETVHVLDISTDPRIQYPEAAREEGIRSILSQPMTARGQIIGVIRIYTHNFHEFSKIEKEFISGLADIGGIAIENARMYSHLSADYQNLINDVHQWFDYGSTHGSA